METKSQELRLGLERYVTIARDMHWKWWNCPTLKQLAEASVSELQSWPQKSIPVLFSAYPIEVTNFRLTKYTSNFEENALI